MNVSIIEFFINSLFITLYINHVKVSYQYYKFLFYIFYFSIDYKLDNDLLFRVRRIRFRR